MFLKSIHIIAATIVTGTGTGIAFFMLLAMRSDNLPTMISVSRFVIIADWVFTAPAVVIQIITGLYLAELLNISYSSAWFLSVIGVFIFIGVCWIPVIFIQYKIHYLLVNKIVETQNILTSNKQLKNLFMLWIALGIPAFSAILIMFWLMIFKPLALF